MAKNYDKKLTFSRKYSNQGVRGGVAYRELSDSYAGDKNYPRLLYVSVNTVLAVFATAIVLGLLLIFTPLGELWRGTGSEVELLYTLEFYDVNGDLTLESAAGTEVLDPATGKSLGRIVRVEKKPYVLPDSFLRSQESTDSSAVIISVTVMLVANYEEDLGYTANGMRIAKGESYTVAFGDSMATGMCVSIEKGW